MDSTTLPLSNAQVIVWYYGLPREDVAVRPIRIPHSSYYYEINESYTQKLDEVFWKGYETDETPTEHIADQISFDIDNDGKIEHCYLIDQVAQVVVTYYVKVMEEGFDQECDYRGSILFAKTDEQVVLDEFNGVLRLKVTSPGKSDIYYDCIISENGTMRFE